MKTAVLIDAEDAREGDVFTHQGFQVLDVTLTDAGLPSLLLERDDRCSVRVFDAGTQILVDR